MHGGSLQLKAAGRKIQNYGCNVVKNTREQAQLLQRLCFLRRCLPHCLKKRGIVTCPFFSGSTQANNREKEIIGKSTNAQLSRKVINFFMFQTRKSLKLIKRQAVLWTERKMLGVTWSYIKGQLWYQLPWWPQANASRPHWAFISSPAKWRQPSLLWLLHRCLRRSGEILNTTAFPKQQMMSTKTGH